VNILCYHIFHLISEMAQLSRCTIQPVHFPRYPLVANTYVVKRIPSGDCQLMLLGNPCGNIIVPPRVFCGSTDKHSHMYMSNVEDYFYIVCIT
jgi:hypothetical protein